MLTAPLTTMWVLAPAPPLAVGSAVNTTLASAPRVRLVALMVSALVRPSEPLPTVMASWPSESRRAPSIAPPPVMFSASAPAPNAISPITMPFCRLKVSAPEPKLIPPMIAGSSASSTPSPSASASAIPSFRSSPSLTPFWVRVTPVVFLLTSMAIALPVITSLLARRSVSSVSRASSVGVIEAVIRPVFSMVVSVPELSITP